MQLLTGTVMESKKKWETEKHILAPRPTYNTQTVCKQMVTVNLHLRPEWNKTLREADRRYETRQWKYLGELTKTVKTKNDATRTVETRRKTAETVRTQSLTGKKMETLTETTKRVETQSKTAETARTQSLTKKKMETLRQQGQWKLSKDNGNSEYDSRHSEDS